MSAVPLSSGDDDNFQIMDTAEIAAKVASTTQIMTTLLAAVAGVRSPRRRYRHYEHHAGVRDGAHP